jgi:hypothetical protein
MSVTPNLGLELVPANSLQPSIPTNDSLQVIDALLQLAVIDKDETVPPATVGGDVGKRWIVGPAATGDWATHDDEIALCTAAGVWRFIPPKEGFAAWVIDEALEYRYTAGAWVLDGGS